MQHIEYDADAVVELYGLKSRPELNGQTGHIIKYDATVRRWQVRLASREIVRVQPANVRGDHLRLTESGKKSVVLMRSQWKDPEDVTASANQMIINVLTTRSRVTVQDFHGDVTVHVDGKRPMEHVPPVMMVIPSKSPTWGKELHRGISQRLPGYDVREAPLPWTASLDEFMKTSMVMVAAAHAHKQLVQVVRRTEQNQERFAMVQMFSQQSDRVALATMHRGHMICHPTDAVVFHSDNFVMLPTTMTLEQAVRKVAQIVEGEGYEEKCFLCLESIFSKASRFMPCSCKVNVHIECAARICKKANAKCPVCRGELSDELV